MWQFWITFFCYVPHRIVTNTSQTWVGSPLMSELEHIWVSWDITEPTLFLYEPNLPCCFPILRNVNLLCSNEAILVMQKQFWCCLGIELVWGAKRWEAFCNQLGNLGKAPWKRWCLSFFKVERKLAKQRGGERYSRRRKQNQQNWEIEAQPGEA